MWDPFDEINKIKREMDKMFDDFFNKSERGFSSKKGVKDFNIPLSDVKRDKDEVIINLDMPGVDKKDIIITVRDNILEVKAEKKHEAKIEKKGMYRYERSYSGFHRSLSLPENVDSDNMKSEYKDGVLKIVIPKAKKKEAKKLVIKG